MKRGTASLFVRVVVVSATTALAEHPRVFFVPANLPPSTNSAGRLQLANTQQGGIICLDLCGSSPAPGMHKSIQLGIGDATGGASGAILLDCATVMIDTGDPSHPGNTLNYVNLLNCVGGPPHQAVYSFGQSPGGAANIALAATGSYLGEACWNVSADACGSFAIDYLGAQCNRPFETCGMTHFLAADGFFSVPILDDGVDVDLGPPPANDGCANATPLGDPLGFAAFPYDTTCATGDGQPALCGALDGDIWYSYTATCTGFNPIWTTGGADWAVYNASGGCVPTPVDELGCGASVAEAVLVQQGQDYLIRIGTDDASSTVGDLMFFRPAYCTENLPAGHPLTVSECGGASECTLPFCETCVGCVEVSAPDGSACLPDGDGLFCTIDDGCQAGVCTGGAPRDCSDDFSCTVDACNEALDQCSHADVNATPCADIADCPVGANRCANGLCECFESPDLCINAAPGGCYDEGANVVVTVEMGFSTLPICTAQFFLQYDPSGLDFVSISPGGGVFTNVVYQAVDEGAGTIDYALGASPAQVCNGTQGPATVATIVFTAVGNCEASGICFRPHNPATKLGAASGGQVCPAGHEGPLCHDLIDPCCSGAFHFDGTPPTMLCPGDVVGPADCGRETKFATFDLPAYAWDDCDGGVPVECAIFNGNGVDVDHLLPGGGDFPPGATTIVCTATQETCGNVAECVFSVINSGLNRLWVDLELSPTMKQGPIVRAISLSLTDCGDVGDGVSVEVCADVELGFPYHLPGHGSARVEVPAANYSCLEAWDRLHGLKAACDVTCEVIDGNSVWYAAFKNSPELNGACHWLINGNLNGDSNIDVIDYAQYLACIDDHPVPGRDTPCTFTEAAFGLHCDLNGDGIVSLADFSFIAVNFFDDDKAGCEAVCDPSATPPAQAGPIASVSVRELDRMGLGRVARMADMNRNGVVDMTDMALYANGGGGVPSIRDPRPVAREGRTRH
ncbi:MAG: hypothetical protein HOP29_01780 [Phycisphaerales bacterium]|nr:hypothetical protein [Phycisphaerales bacterium]